MNKSIGYYLARFAVFYVATLAVVWALTTAAYAFAPGLAARVFEGGGRSGIGVVILMVPVMLMAQQFWKQEGRRETRREGWTLALWGTLLAFAISALLFVGMQAVFPDPVTTAQLTEVWSGAPGILLGVGAVFFLLYLLIFRVMLWAGLRGETRKAERLAKKAR